MCNKLIQRQTQWGKVANELAAETVKLASYDNLLLQHIGSVHNVKILDYGCGPAIALRELKARGADVYGFDISPSMINLAKQHLPSHKLSTSLDPRMKGYFDEVICNLVLCIVEDREVLNITKNIHGLLKNGGQAHIGFCNPKIFNIPESQLDFRETTSSHYKDNHEYRKIKKEGNYTIIEKHRPIHGTKRSTKKLISKS